MKRRKAFSRADRERQILLVFAIDIQRGLPNRLTAYTIARKLDVTPSTKLNNILRNMVDKGMLEKTELTEVKGRWPTYFYSLPKGTYQTPRRTRIPIKTKGQLIGQLEMFS